jgi:HEPN domain-containing protein
MQETGVVIPRTHDLETLVNLLVVRDPAFSRMLRPAHILTPYAVGFRYPGKSATKRQAQAAIRHAEKVRAVVRRSPGLSS